MRNAPKTKRTQQVSPLLGYVEKMQVIDQWWPVNLKTNYN